MERSLHKPMVFLYPRSARFGLEDPVSLACSRLTGWFRGYDNVTVQLRGYRIVGLDKNKGTRECGINVSKARSNRRNTKAHNAFGSQSIAFRDPESKGFSS